MPTTPCRARHLIKAGEAEVVKRTPFTIRMLIETSEANQAPRFIGGFRLKDKVMYNGQLCLIHGRRSSGYFDIRKPDGTQVHSSIHYRNIMLVEHADTKLYYKEEAVHPSVQG